MATASSVSPNVSAAAAAATSARLCRLHDKLAALGFPYFFDEAAPPTHLADAFFGATPAGAPRPPHAGAWWPLRDAVVFAEEGIIAAAPAALRAALRAPTPPAFVAAMCDYVDHLRSLVPSAAADGAPPVFAALHARAVATASATARDAAGATPERRLAAVLVLVNAILDCATLAEVRFGVGTEALRSSHEQWSRDQPRTLVTSLAPLPPCPSARLLRPRPGPDELGDDAAENNLRTLLEPLFRLRGLPLPEPTSAALSEVVRLVQALPQPARSAVSCTDDAALKMLLQLVPSPCRAGAAAAAPKKGTQSGAQSGGIEDAAKVLRLLYTLDLKSLQDDVNSQIAELQNITATCRTDPRLGRVGR